MGDFRIFRLGKLLFSTQCVLGEDGPLLKAIVFYAAIYSGDYKWFESESEEDLEGDSPTGSPVHGRTPTPSEVEKPQIETKDPKHKGRNEVEIQLGLFIE